MLLTGRLDFMSYSSEQSQMRILESARQEFLKYGYSNANLRRIAKNAHVTTGALYNYFSGKDGLFDTLVEETAEDMFSQFRARHEQASGDLLNSDKAGDWATSVLEGSVWIIDYIYQHYPAVKLLFCRAEGTKWVDYLEQFIELEEHAYRIYCDVFCQKGWTPSDFFLHCTAAAGFQFLEHIVEHDLSYEEAVRVMEEEQRFRLAGWRKIMG